MLVAGDRASVRIIKRHHPDIRYDVVVVADDGNDIFVTAPWVEPEARDAAFVD